MVVSNTGKYIASGQKTYQGFKVSDTTLSGLSQPPLI